MNDGKVADREPKIPVYIACLRSIIQLMHSHPTTEWDRAPVVPADGRVVSFKQTFFARVSYMCILVVSCVSIHKKYLYQRKVAS
jgi:hypothetical protein